MCDQKTAVTGTDLMIERVHSNVQCRVVPLHLLSLLHVHLHRTPLSRADASHAEHDQKHEKANADDGNHRNPCTCHIACFVRSGFRDWERFITWNQFMFCTLSALVATELGFHSPTNQQAVFLPLRKLKVLCGHEKQGGKTQSVCAKQFLLHFYFCSSPNWQMIFYRAVLLSTSVCPSVKRVHCNITTSACIFTL